MSRFLQDAVNTSIGHADPINGTQLDTAKNLPSPAAYYKPNDGIYAFIDPTATLTPAQLIMFQRDSMGSLGVSVGLASHFTDLGPVTWAWGDGTANTVGSRLSHHKFAAPGAYTVTVTATSVAHGAITATVSIGVDKAISKPVNTAVPTIAGTPKVGIVLTGANGTWTGATTGLYTYQWSWSNKAAIVGATGPNYTPVSADIGKMLILVVGGTNSRGTSHASSVATIAVVA